MRGPRATLARARAWVVTEALLRARAVLTMEEAGRAEPARSGVPAR